MPKPTATERQLAQLDAGKERTRLERQRLQARLDADNAERAARDAASWQPWRPARRKLSATERQLDRIGRLRP